MKRRAARTQDLGRAEAGDQSPDQRDRRRVLAWAGRLAAFAGIAMSSPKKAGMAMSAKRETIRLPTPGFDGDVTLESFEDATIPRINASGLVLAGNARAGIQLTIVHGQGINEHGLSQPSTIGPLIVQFPVVDAELDVTEIRLTSRCSHIVFDVQDEAGS